MLSASGELERRVGGASEALTAEFSRRSIYAKTSRFQPDETMSLFDLPSASVTCEQRVVTNVPLQKLFLLNSDVVQRRAAVLAKRIAKTDIDEGITVAYYTVFQREPSATERKSAREFLSDVGDEGWTQFAWVLLSSTSLPMLITQAFTLVGLAARRCVVWRAVSACSD